jgi:hypothetical protein
MARSSYPYLIQRRHRWFVRMVVPPDLRDIVGHAIFKAPTSETDQHHAATIAAPIIAGLRKRIDAAREAGKRLEQVTADAEQPAERYRAEPADEPERPRSRASRMSSSSTWPRTVTPGATMAGRWSRRATMPAPHCGTCPTVARRPIPPTASLATPPHCWPISTAGSHRPG